jgi:hypothetical protein
MSGEVYTFVVNIALNMVFLILVTFLSMSYSFQFIFLLQLFKQIYEYLFHFSVFSIRYLAVRNGCCLGGNGSRLISIIIPKVST